MPDKIEIYTKLVIKRESKKVLLKCATCGGKGLYGSRTCGVCEGDGVVWKTVSGGDLYKCRTCSGEGLYGSRTCGICSGVGVVVGKSPRIKCGTCEGEGLFAGHTCNNCNGYGSIHTDSINEY